MGKLRALVLTIEREKQQANKDLEQQKHEHAKELEHQKYQEALFLKRLEVRRLELSLQMAGGTHISILYFYISNSLL